MALKRILLIATLFLAASCQYDVDGLGRATAPTPTETDSPEGTEVLNPGTPRPIEEADEEDTEPLPTFEPDQKEEPEVLEPAPPPTIEGPYRLRDRDRLEGLRGRLLPQPLDIDRELPAGGQDVQAF